VIVTTAFQSVRSSKEQQHLRDDAQKTEKDLSNKVSEQGGKLDAISHFEQQFLTFVSQSQRAPGSPDAATKAYEAMALAVMKMAQGSPSTTGNVQAKRIIQSVLSDYITKGSKIRDDWKKAMVQHENQEPHASKAQKWHTELESYLRTTPRGRDYIVRLNAAMKTGSGGWPMGIDYKVSEDFDRLASDLAMLENFMTDPQLGEP
jgi:hypothetical protein